jgi:hypothetical protein
MTEVTYKPTLGWIQTLPTREGSLKHVKTENTQNIFGNEHTEVIFCNRIGFVLVFKRVGRKNKRKKTLGNGVKSEDIL